jgi:predicted glycosyltransferase involved in capsule biosynthesis
MAKKKTLICIHVMPSEIEMFERLMFQMRKALQYLDDNDDVTLKVTMNLNPELTDWQNSELKNGHFISRFAILFNGIKNINEVILDTSCWGTTQQKRESYKMDYDQFIFCDTDILFHEHMLKHQLNISYQLDGVYIVSPSLPKWWDNSWDELCHSDYIDKEFGYATTKEAIDNALIQNVNSINARQVQSIKFGCGMHTLYSKSFWEFVGIPESFGGYGPEDTYGMSAAQLAIKLGYDIKQFVMDGIYITEDYINRTPSFDGKIKPIDRKKEFYDKAHALGQKEVINFGRDLMKKQPNP